jgi:Ca2+-binding EF-hand superfamily protein
MVTRTLLTAAVAAAALTLAALTTPSGSRAQTQAQPQQQGQAGQPGQRGDADEPRLGRFMRLLDTNNDGKVSQDEILAEQKRLFTAADVDGDGKLSADEFRRRGAWFQMMNVVTLFDLLDTNGDKTVALEEINNPSKRWFGRYDANGNGAIEPGEVQHERHWRGHHRR